MLFIIFWDFWIFGKFLLSPQVKQILIISNKYGIYELAHEIPNDLTRSKLRSLKIRKYQEDLKTP